ncbi:MAG: histidinol dehydrogenase [Bacteroidales bacterium]|nr:histidinol dehydrogenase [Bacteroidales bacterium]
METFISPDRKIWGELVKRPSSSNPELAGRVAAIVDKVERGGDAAIREIEESISGIGFGWPFEVGEAEVAEASSLVSDEVKKAVADAAANIRAFHKAQLPSPVEVMTAPGVRCLQKPVPISRVGLYIPGGTAPLFSTVLMLAIPAEIAGCPEVVLCTPAGPDGKVNPAVLYAAKYCGVGRVFRIGGAQAIAAMAFGTESVPKVDKIFGPGNQYVTTAKQMLGGRRVAIDMPAGPSEVMVIADSTADPAFVAADLLSQAEHGRDSQVMLVCPDEAFASSVLAEVDRQVATLSREAFALDALSKSRALVFGSDDEIVDFANLYAPEHLIIQTSDPWKIADRIVSAGSVFVGKYTPESAGDYASGTNHTLPTCGWGASYSGVNIDSYMRKMTLQEISPEGLAGLAGTIVTMAEAEGLEAHANAVKVRLGK